MGGVLVLHNRWGVSAGISAYAEQLADLGHDVALPDLYGDGSLPRTHEDARAAWQRLDAEVARERVTAAAAHVAEEVAAPLAVVSFGISSQFALDLAWARPDVAALVLHYGVGTPPAVGRTEAAVLGHFGDHDDYVELDDVQALGERLSADGVRATFHAYAGARRWFAESDRPEYDADAAELAFARTREFLATHLPADADSDRPTSAATG